MQALSVSSHAAEPYRAGLELGAALSACEPEVVFLFGTINYDNPSLLEGLYDSLDNDDLVVVGCSGDGVLESAGPAPCGVAALGLNTDRQVQWRVFSASGLREKPAHTTRTLLTRAQQWLDNRPATWMFFVADFRADASCIETVLATEAPVPVVGGLAADDNHMRHCNIYCNREVGDDSAALLVASGPINFRIKIGNTLRPVGKPGLIDAARGTQIDTIDGIAAMDFVERETGKPVLQSDRGVTALTIIDDGEPHIKRLRSIVPIFSDGDGANRLNLYGGIESGRQVQVCLARPEDLIEESRRLAAEFKAEGFLPQAALVVTCAGRKWLLGEAIEQEVRALKEAFGETLPVVGFPSFGEIGPLLTASGYSRNLFHNMTCVVTLIGLCA